ncbi:hypothetical protein LTR84_005068 [Exophiala bonariae]|uniref:DUF7918 domain-containing protein n=1 Tax=Exophiala bonariae TaxID=1690606 RepID=A0AAV9NP67_9EURO|nr:hypothetical protein LTR84_005068 [Exophiala bonariae]
MPTLKDLACVIQWANTGSPFPEYATQYGDSVVETYIAIPSHPQAFTIRLTSRRFICEGLAMIVYIDGNYQCNRNRVNLQPHKKDLPQDRSEVDFIVRQKEKPMGDGTYMGREWRFDDHNIVSTLPPGVNQRHFDELGTIEVLVLRCKASNPIQAEMSSPSSGEHSLLHFDDLNPTEEVANQAGPTNGPLIDDQELEQEDAGLGGLFGLFDGPSDYPPGSYGRHLPPPSNGYQPQIWPQLGNAYERYDPHRSAGPPYAPQQGPSQLHYYRPEPEPINVSRQKTFTRERYPPHQGADYGPGGPNRRAHFDHANPNIPPEPHYDHIPHQPDRPTWQGNPPNAYDRVTSEYQRPQTHLRTPNTHADYALPSDNHYTYDAETRAYHGYPAHSQMNGGEWPADGHGRMPLHPSAYLGHPGYQHIQSFGHQPRYAHRPPNHPAFHVQQGPWVAAQPPMHPQPIPIVIPPSLIPIPHPVTGVPICPAPNPAPFFPTPPTPWFGQPSVDQSVPQHTSGGEAATNIVNTSGADVPRSGATGNNDSSAAPDAWGNPSNDQNTTANTNSNNTQTNNGDDWNNNSGGQTNDGNGWANTANDTANNNQNANGDEWANANNDNSNQDNNGDEWANVNNDNSNQNTNGDGWGNTNNDNTNQNESGGGWGNDNSNQNNNENGWDTSNENQNSNEQNWDNNKDATQNNTGGGWADNGQDSKPQPDNWNDNQATNTNDNAVSTLTPVNNGLRSLYGPHGAYLTPKVFADDVPADAEEEPRYDVPQAIAKDRGTSKQVQPGKGYIYNKKRCAPIYIDTMDEPYARFVFKYRTKEQIKSETGIEITAEPTGDEHFNALEQLDKAELIQMVLRAKGALGGQIPAPSPKDTTVETPLILFEQVPVAPPEVPFLKYSLPPGRAVSSPGLGIKTGTSNNSSNQQSSADQNWGSSGNNNNNTNGNGWDNNDSGGGASGWNDSPANNDNNNNNNSGGGAGWDGQQESNDATTKPNGQSNTGKPKAQEEADETAKYIASMATAAGPVALDWSTPTAAPKIQTIGSGVVGGGTTSVSYSNDKPPTPPLKPCSPPMQSSGDWGMGPPLEDEAPTGVVSGW